ncbi:hypothetical protein [Bacillus sp. Marseille-P3800]|uniref:hypothetical protein n=1 Tax=Bacillus sp. Marseille-P3800 TaxID=2014782 RepID=UPI000C06EDDB|nr:hypothetical protein [Bacillus sp. Marseille-P3800]
MSRLYGTITTYITANTQEISFTGKIDDAYAKFSENDEVSKVVFYDSEGNKKKEFDVEDMRVEWDVDEEE